MNLSPQSPRCADRLDLIRSSPARTIGRDVFTGARRSHDLRDRRRRRRQIPSKGAPASARSDLLSSTRSDLAPMSAPLAVMERDAKRMRGVRPFVFTNVRSGRGSRHLVDFIEEKGGLARGGNGHSGRASSLRANPESKLRAAGASSPVWISWVSAAGAGAAPACRLRRNHKLALD